VRHIGTSGAALGPPGVVQEASWVSRVPRVASGLGEEGHEPRPVILPAASHQGIMSGKMAEELVVSESPLITLLLCAAQIPILGLFFVIAPLWFALIGVVVALAFSYELLFRYAYAVTVSGDGTIRFRSMLRRRTTKATDVQSIFLRRWGWGEGKKARLVRVAFGGGSVLLTRSDQTLAFAQRVRAFNPGVQTRGL
jgi:hypothetical protein